MTIINPFRSAMQAGSARFRLRKPTVAILPALVLSVTLLAIILAPLIAPYDPADQDLMNMLAAPSGAHWFGTDLIGRDLFSRVLWGGWPPLIVGIGSMLLALLLGTAAGILAGYNRGAVDSVIGRIADIQMSIPGLVLALLVLALFGASVSNMIAIIAIESWPLHFRVVRSHVLSVRRLAYIEAAELAGHKTLRIVCRHIVPSTLPLLAVTATINFSHAVLTEAGLSFLGIGVQPPTADWGTMVAEGQTQLSAAWWISVFPGLALLLVLLCTQLIGDRLSRRASVSVE